MDFLPYLFALIRTGQTERAQMIFDLATAQLRQDIEVLIADDGIESAEKNGYIEQTRREIADYEQWWTHRLAGTEPPAYDFMPSMETCCHYYGCVRHGRDFYIDPDGNGV